MDTLDVIVECAVLVAVFAQQTESVNVCKVLKLNQTVHPIPVERRAGQQRPLIDWINHHPPMGDISDTRWRRAACAFKDYFSPEGGDVLLHYTAQGERWEETLQLLNAQSLHNRINSLFWMCLVTRTSFKLNKNTNLSNPHSGTYKIHRALSTVVFYRHLMSWHLFHPSVWQHLTMSFHEGGQTPTEQHIHRHLKRKEHRAHPAPQ